MFDPIDLVKRRNTTAEWLPGDTVGRHSPVNCDGVSNYTKTEITYKFNSHGFRSDEFDCAGDHRVLFMGCSFTEGIGLPLDEIYTHHVLSKIRNQPRYSDKVVPHLSVALGGSGTDTASRILFEYVDLIRPSRIIYVWPSWIRRDLIMSYENSMWLPAYAGKENSSPGSDECDRIFSDIQYGRYQTYRSFAIIESVVARYGCQMDVFDMPNADPEFLEYVKRRCPHMTFHQAPSRPNDMSNMTAALPERIRHRSIKARDNAHPGAATHWALSEFIWETIRHNYE